MADENRKHTDTGQNAEHDQLDRMLDATLAKYTAVEPRAGLEERVLANLRVEQAQVTSHPWWRWSAVAAAAILVVAIMLTWRAGRSSHPATANHPAVTAPSANEPEIQVVLNSGTSQAPRPAQGINSHRSHPSSFIAATPKLDVFPSPQPLSEQEQILAAYVTQYHERAVLLARVTNEELQRDRMEVLGDSAGGTDLGESTDKEKTNR
jgi:hypothetical protein